MGLKNPMAVPRVEKIVVNAGIGKTLKDPKLLENIAARPELEKDYEFYLYFKSEIPKLSFLDAPIFHKKIISQPFQHKSFVLYYYLFLPVNLWFERLDVMFFPNYMLPIIFFKFAVSRDISRIPMVWSPRSEIIMKSATKS